MSVGGLLRGVPDGDEKPAIRGGVDNVEGEKANLSHQPWIRRAAHSNGGGTEHRPGVRGRVPMLLLNRQLQRPLFNTEL
jgi:hypothetical protein